MVCICGGELSDHYTVGERACHGHGLIQTCECKSYRSAAGFKHEYSDESDCTCGRNFTTVRGLREHLTKSRR